MSYPHETLWNKSANEEIIFTEFPEDRTKNVNFLLMANFWTCLISFDPDFITQDIAQCAKQAQSWSKIYKNQHCKILLQCFLSILKKDKCISRSFRLKGFSVGVKANLIVQH